MDTQTCVFSGAGTKDEDRESALASVDWFATHPIKHSHERFLRCVIDTILKEAVFHGTERHTPVVEWIEPEKLRKILGNELPNEPQAEEKLLQYVKDVVRYSVKTGHPRFINQLFSR